MPIVVHIADAKNIQSIRRSGIRPAGSNSVIYLMPVTANHFVSHQWLRELKRSGVRQLMGVYVRLASSELVWAGRYNQRHEMVTLGDAIHQLNNLHDPLGFEMFICRKIDASEIHQVRTLPQVIGWRYMPHAHGHALCGCPACLPRGSIKSRVLRQRLEPKVPIPSLQAVQAQLSTANDVDEILNALWPLRMKRRKVDPSFLESLFATDNELVLEELAMTLPYIRYSKSIEMLLKLQSNENPAISSAAREGLALFEPLQANPNET